MRPFSLAPSHPCPAPLCLHRSDGEASRQHLVAQAEAFLQRYPRDGYSGGGDLEEVRRVRGSGLGLVEGGPARMQTPSPHVPPQVSILSAPDAGTPLAPIESRATLALGGEGSSASEGPPSPASGGGGRLDGVSGEPQQGTNLQFSCNTHFLDAANTQCVLPFYPSTASAVERYEEGGSSSKAALQQDEHRWGAPFRTQVALLFRRSLRTRRFQASACGLLH